jgi:cyclic pyranopterin phosphate synthase
MLDTKSIVRTGIRKLKTTTGWTSGKIKPADWRCFNVSNHKIAPPLSCELNAVDHCNIACLDCNHASPGVDANCADPDCVYNDFSRLAKVYHADSVKVLGGEPLLHPDLLSLITAVRKSKISEKIWLVTNGTLLHLMPDNIWKAIDQLEVSLYPETNLKMDRLLFIQKKAAQYHVHLTRYFYHTFRTTFSMVGTNDDNLVRRIYRACKLANLWGCQSVYQGHFFKCPQSIYIPKILDADKTHNFADNGLEILESHTFYKKLTKYLSLREPLKACRYCLGCVGKLRPHRLFNKKNWKTAHQQPTEEVIDFEKLRRIESGLDEPDVSKACLYNEDCLGLSSNVLLKDNH